MKESYGTLSETLNGLKQAGYLLDFNTKEDCIVCHHTNTILSPDDFEIDKYFVLRVNQILPMRQLFMRFHLEHLT
jgi:hypothetical protein